MLAFSVFLLFRLFAFPLSPIDRLCTQVAAGFFVLIFRVLFRVLFLGTDLLHRIRCSELHQAGKIAANFKQTKTMPAAFFFALSHAPACAPTLAAAPSVHA